MTVTEFVDYVRNMHNASSDSNWSDSEIYSLIRSRAQEALSIIGLVEATSTTTSVSGTNAYDYPTNVVVVRRVLYDGIALKQITFREWESRKVSGTDPSGTPTEYVLWNNQIILVPTPSTSSDTITIYSEKQQSAITSTSSTIDVPEVLHYRLADGVIGQMFIKDLNPQMATFFENKWNTIHIPAFREFKMRRRHGYQTVIAADSDASLNTSFGVI
jgi:hypothetical protein